MTNDMRIAVPVTASTMEEALSDIDAATLVADIIELRIDYMREKPDLEQLIKQSQKPVIVTNRHISEGGKFQGSEEERIAYLRQAIELGAAYVDIELNHFHRLVRNLQTMLIVSYHDFRGTPENLLQIYSQMVNKGANIAKIATMARNPEDCSRMLDLVASISKAGGNIIGLCMGEEGKSTRILGPARGGYLTYAPLSIDGASAPGQLTVSELRAAWARLGIKQ
ncbi:type I 3-dehydroquinate dehydratase [Candidatus Woesearchaeota archaeon]|nr:type I 3-dehydroquinate dehydratase [Candidatus Woesearchaeota archaeon]